MLLLTKISKKWPYLKEKILFIFISVPELMKTDTWKLEDKLEPHFQYVSAIDWNANTNVKFFFS